MKPSDIQNKMDRMKSEFLTPEAHISAGVYYGEASVFAWPRGVMDGLTLTGTAPTWESALEILRVKLIAYSVEHDMGLVRNMALKVIDLTDIGMCTDDRLRAAGFTDMEISQSGKAACEMAAKMSARGPFSIDIEQRAAAE